MSQTVDATADPFSNRLAGRRLGRYEVLARLAGGGMASVYVARALGVAGFERLFAVKVLHPHLAHEEEFITMFLDEARLAARIRHPNVVATIDISDTQDAGYYLVMDYIEGDHLGALLQYAFKRGQRLPAPIALRVVVDALDGLAAAHSLTDETGRPLNLVHRDISPHNIMVSTDGIARITDFGVAKAEFRLSTTREGQFKGKLAYMAPEHASNGESDQRSDLFAMAIILWESLAGRRLFRAENHAATLNKICLEPIPPLSEADPALAPFDAILRKGLSRNPEERFQTAHEFAEAIEKEAHKLGGLASPRAVAKLVREYAAEKIERDQQCIREAMADLSQAQEAMQPEESGAHQRGDTGAAHASASPQAAVPPLPVPAPLGPLTTEGLADSLEPELARDLPEATQSKRSLRVAAVVLGLGAGVAVAAMLWGGGSEGSQTQSRVEAVSVPPASDEASADSPVAPTEVAEEASEVEDAEPVEDSAGPPTEPTEATAGGLEPKTPTVDEDPESPEARERAQLEARARRRRKAREQAADATRPKPSTAAATTDNSKAAPTPSKPAPPPAASPDDELLLNPYR